MTSGLSERGFLVKIEAEIYWKGIFVVLSEFQVMSITISWNRLPE